MPLDLKRGVKKVASESVFRCRSDDLPPARTHVGLRKLNTELLSSGPFGYIDVEGLDLVPVDIDVSPLGHSGSSKEGVSYTYKGHDGYALVCLCGHSRPHA
ncbi:MAG: hypothetical protein GKR87_00805 [Kiritimatiellae bacterium]|nr:hypothetical protein [Kiritimatiellia bacterium]